MAATLASVCSVPLTSVLLLFELTKDYRILLPLMVSLAEQKLTSSSCFSCVLLKAPMLDINTYLCYLISKFLSNSSP